MRQLFIIFAIAISACSSTSEKSKDSQQSQNTSDSVYIKKGYKKYQSKHEFSFYYSNIWRQLGKEFFDNVIKTSYKELDPSTDYEAGFNFNNDKNEYIFPRFHIETNLTAPPKMDDLKKQLGDFDLAKVFEDDKKETWTKQQDEQVAMLSSKKPTVDEKKHIVYFSSVINVEGQGDMYCLSVLFLGKSSMVSVKFFLPEKEKDKYLDAVFETIDSFHYDKGFEYQN